MTSAGVLRTQPVAPQETGRQLAVGGDVGPVTRQFSPKKGDCFGDPYRLTLLDELGRRQVAERAVWPALIVVDAPRFDLRLCVAVS
jgi:hypothetical protein